MNKILIFFLIQIIAISGFSQTKPHRFFVYYKNKQTADYPYSLDKPTEFLTQRAIDRRTKNKVDIQENDLPVNPKYVDSLSNLGFDVYFSSKWLNGSIIQMDSSKIDELIKLAFVDSIALIAENPRLTRDKTQKPQKPTNFRIPEKFDGDSNFQLSTLGANNMHKEGIKGNGVLIAILDNGFIGVDKFKPFEKIWNENRIIATKDFVGNQGNVFQYGSHGTSVFSIIGADYQTKENVFLGIAPKASFVLCVTEEGNSEDKVEEYNWLLGAEYADSLGADVINSSLGYNEFDIKKHSYIHANLDGETAICTIAADIAASKGIVVVISAGNEATKKWKKITPPADAKNILAVGSINQNFKRSSFSSFGPSADGRVKPDVAAFGSATTNMNGSGNIRRGSGTSFASPLIAGLVAGIIEKRPTWTQKEIRKRLKNTANQFDKPDSLLGFGVPYYTYAIHGKRLNISDIYNAQITVYPNPFQGETLYLNIEGKFKKGIHIRVFDTRYGNLILEKRLNKKEASGEIPLKFSPLEKGLYIMDVAFGKKHQMIKLINF